MASKQPTGTVRELIGDIAPKLTELTADVSFGDIWERPGLSKRDPQSHYRCGTSGGLLALSPHYLSAFLSTLPTGRQRDGVHLFDYLRDFVRSEVLTAEGQYVLL